jgi:hypothetical protein
MSCACYCFCTLPNVYVLYYLTSIILHLVTHFVDLAVEV